MRNKAEISPELVAPPLVHQNQQALEFEGSSICLRKLHPTNPMSVTYIPKEKQHYQFLTKMTQKTLQYCQDHILALNFQNSHLDL